VKPSSYQPVGAGRDGDSLAIQGQTFSLELFNIARRAVLKFVPRIHPDTVRSTFGQAKLQAIRLRPNAGEPLPKVCPRCGTTVASAPLGLVTPCRGCQAPLLIV
jgi:hypothetical protein